MHITEGDSAMKKWLRSAWDAIQENQQRRADYWVQGIIYGEESNRKAT
jgi:hypothetical protein